MVKKFIKCANPAIICKSQKKIPMLSPTVHFRTPDCPIMDTHFLRHR